MGLQFFCDPKSNMYSDIVEYRNIQILKFDWMLYINYGKPKHNNFKI